METVSCCSSVSNNLIGGAPISCDHTALGSREAITPETLFAFEGNLRKGKQKASCLYYVHTHCKPLLLCTKGDPGHTLVCSVHFEKKGSGTDFSK